MITLQMMKGTGPYNQMQRYIADVHKDLTPQQRAGKFTALLKKYVNNQNKRLPGQGNVPRNLLQSFNWGLSPEGPKFWLKVDSYSADPIVNPRPVVAEQPPVKEQPKPAAPALVWPKGATHYRPDIKRFFNERGQWPVDMNLQFHDFLGKQTYENWSALPQTIKRPETPLPNGLQWEEGYTHYDPTLFMGTDKPGFFFNEKHWVRWLNGWSAPQPMGKAEYLNHSKRPTAVERYPDNQPLILDVEQKQVLFFDLEAYQPVLQAPVRPVGRRGDEPVPQAPVMENVAVKAPVEPPKAKKQVGWWK